jgi:hypothetical protein
MKKKPAVIPLLELQQELIAYLRFLHLLFQQPKFNRQDLFEVCQELITMPRTRICKRVRSPGIDSKESIPPAYVTWRAGTTNRVIAPARQST